MARGNRGVGTKMSLDGKYALGDPAEIAQRDKTCYSPAATHFTQIGPGGSGRNLNEPSKGSTGSPLKWSRNPN